MPHDSAGRAISDAGLARAQFGLADGAFVFCCFNNAYKFNPRAFASRMRILKAVEGSVLWLSEGHAEAMANLRKQAAAAGVAPERLIFATRVASMADHLARHRLADLFLDTLPYNAHTTASDALWAGLPVLTQIGESFAGRVAASLLTAIDLPELIVQTIEQFESSCNRTCDHARKTFVDQRATGAELCNRAAVRYRAVHAPSRKCLRGDDCACAPRALARTDRGRTASLVPFAPLGLADGAHGHGCLRKLFCVQMVRGCSARANLPLAGGACVGHIGHIGDVAEWLKAAVC